MWWFQGFYRISESNMTFVSDMFEALNWEINERLFIEQSLLFSLGTCHVKYVHQTIIIKKWASFTARL